MDTPIADFIDRYAALDPVRLHMPGHKGRTEPMDITEIPGADVLYEATGIIRESEEHAASLFGSGRTIYSTEGASLAIRAMLCLTRMLSGRAAPRIAASRNSHISFYTGAALLGIDTVDIYPGEDGYVGTEAISSAVANFSPDALYLTSPDYEGRMADIRSAADIAHAAGIPLLVDNAHGAYLKFLSPSLHPLDLGADMSSDSAHKTLPVLTGGAYLHIAPHACELFYKEAEHAAGIFASTSPSYLILRSLDIANRLIADGLDADIRAGAGRVASLKAALSEKGYTFIGDEPMKLTVDAASYGYRGDEMAALLAEKGIYAEAADERELIALFSAATGEGEYEAALSAFSGIEPRPPLTAFTPRPIRGEKVMSQREALLSPAVMVPAERAVGRVLARPVLRCPPGVPIALSGEKVGAELAEALRHLGIGTVALIA